MKSLFLKNEPVVTSSVDSVIEPVSTIVMIVVAIGPAIK
jgi:hypothetical protein